MSIQLHAKVEALEARIASVEQQRDGALMAVDLLAQRVNTLVAQMELLVDLSKPRRPGPKPKDAANG